ncbi:transposase family protein [Cyanobium sp. A1C-AMD]|uniref:transposase family protein n=1 Tax=Cyanobium sp. A1C-AMD TaxID=2823694 RepID=UPI0037C07BC0|nr:transposase family protein [Cyanobium sp. A1C-AMD]
MPQNCSGAVDQLAPADLISFLKAIPDGRFRRGVRYPQWFLLLVAVLGILSGCRSSRDLEAFAKRHRKALNQALSLDFKRWPSDATFLYLFNKAHLQQFGEVLQAWMISQIPGGTEGLDQLVCDGKTLRGSAIETEDGNHRYGLRPTSSTLPRSRSMPAPWELPWRRRLTTPTSQVNEPPSRNC